MNRNRMDPVVTADKPRKSTARLLWALFSLFVVYGTTFPFSFHLGWQGFLSAPRRINWLVLGGQAGDPIISDLVQNILLFMPFGFLGYFSLVYKSSLLKKAAIVLMGAALSASVEFLQMFSATRCPALSDLETNTLGTAVGLCLAMGFKKSVLGFKSHSVARRFLDGESAFPAMVFLMLTMAGCLEPFDFSMDVSTVWGHLKPLLIDPIRFSHPDDDLISLIRYLLTTLFVCRLAQEAGLRKPVLSGVALMWLLGLGLEACQIFVQSRSPELQDALVSMAGTLCGAFVYFFPGFHRRPWIWTLLGGLAVFASASIEGLSPFRFSPRFGGFNWVLFLPQYERTTFAALSEFIESAMVYFPIGFLFAYFHPFPRPALAAAVMAGGLSLAVELGQGFIPGRFADITDVFGAVLGAVAGGLVLTRGWPAFKEYMASDEDRQV